MFVRGSVLHRHLCVCVFSLSGVPLGRGWKECDEPRGGGRAVGLDGGRHRGARALSCGCAAPGESVQTLKFDQLRKWEASSISGILSLNSLTLISLLSSFSSLLPPLFASFLYFCSACGPLSRAALTSIISHPSNIAPTLTKQSPPFHL